MAAYSLALTVVVMLGVAVAILLFERKRADQIKRDLQGGPDQARRSGGRRRES